MRMKYEPLHSWVVSIQEARRIQARFRGQVNSKKTFGAFRLVAGADVCYSTNLASAAIVLMDIERWEEIEAVTAESFITFPYIPGLFAFREGPAILRAWQKLKTKPDVILLDGHGIAHPMRF